MALDPTTLGWLLVAFAGIAIGLFLVYLLYSGIYRAFQHVGFTRGQAALILLGSLLLGFLDIPVWQANGWIVAVNVGGTFIPLLVTVLLLRRYPELAREAIAGITFVALAAYLVTRATPEGITSPFPLFLIPVVVASTFSMIAHWRDAAHAAPLAYVAGTLGALIGADLLHLTDFINQATPAGDGPHVASIGGASVFDMVFLTGVFAVLIDMALFSRRMKERSGVPEAYLEGEVFTPSTPYHVLNGPVKVPVEPRRPPKPRIDVRRS